MLKKIFPYLLVIIFAFFIFCGPILAEGLPNPLGNKSVPELIGMIIQEVLGYVGAIALIMFVYGGLIWMTAAGAPEKITKGKNVVMWAIIGMVLIFSSYAILKAIMKGLGAT